MLMVWFGDPAEEFIAEETGEEVLLIKNQAGTVIGFEPTFRTLKCHTQVLTLQAFEFKGSNA